MRFKSLFLIFILFITACDPYLPDSAEPMDLENMDKLGGVMMQAFYWDVEPKGQWWNQISGELEEWQKIGIDKIWIPPISKGAGGIYSMGYDPMDYFDLGEYNQKGTVKTRFGSKKELEKLINRAHKNNIQVLADIVLNHNSGGDLEFNPYRGRNSYTLFRPKSGKFYRGHHDFHPNNIHHNDAEAMFFEEQDLCHDQEYVRKWLWEENYSVTKYYKNKIKIDGWRFDYVKGFSPWVIKEWMRSVGGFGVMELWDGDADKLRYWVQETGISAFDFANFYNMEKAFDGNNLTLLRDNNALFKMAPFRSVTFVANHDTEKDQNPFNRIDTDENKLLAYAYIFTHPGYPCLFI